MEALTPNEPLTLAAGAEEASWSDDCLDYTRWALAGTDADETLEVPTGEVEGVGAATWSFPE